jgi:hypothetical protein
MGLASEGGVVVASEGGVVVASEGGVVVASEGGVVVASEGGGPLLRGPALRGLAPPYAVSARLTGSGQPYRIDHERG